MQGVFQRLQQFITIPCRKKTEKTAETYRRSRRTTKNYRRNRRTAENYRRSRITAEEARDNLYLTAVWKCPQHLTRI